MQIMLRLLKLKEYILNMFQSFIDLEKYLFVSKKNFKYFSLLIIDIG